LLCSIAAAAAMFELSIPLPKVKTISVALGVRIIFSVSPTKDLNGKSNRTFATAKPAPVPTFDAVLISPEPPPPVSARHKLLAASKTIIWSSKGISFEKCMPKIDNR